MHLRLVSWNVNGARKLNDFPKVLAFLLSASVIYLQETFEFAVPHFAPPGYIRFSSEALETGGRPSRGSATLFQQSCFSNGKFTGIPSRHDWLLITRWQPFGSPKGLLFVNLYFPRHSADFSQSWTIELEEDIRSLREDFPGDGILLGGDFNFNFHATTTSTIDQLVSDSLNVDVFSYFHTLAFMDKRRQLC